MIAIISFTDSGAQIAKLLEAELTAATHFDNRIEGEKVKEKMSEIREKYDSIVFISATGIAVRYIAPYLKHKSIDPAVVVVDDMGKFVISLLSGHLGGANELARLVSGLLPGSVPVITTASDNRGFESPDLYAARHGFTVHTQESLTKITSIMVNGGKLAYYCEIDCDLDYVGLVTVENLSESTDYDGAIAVSSKRLKAFGPMLQLVPKNLHLGIGCRKGTSSEEIIELIEDTFEENGILTSGIASVSSIDIKSEEKGILETAEHYGVWAVFYSKEQLLQVEHLFNSSEFVKETVGVGSVAEPSAYLSGGELLINRVVRNGITLAVSKETSGCQGV